MRKETKPIKLAEVVFALCMGGSENLARRIIQGLHRGGGYRCSMYAVDHGGPLERQLTEEGIPNYAFKRRGKLDVRLICELAYCLRKSKIQVVHTHHLGQLIYGGFAARLAGARVVHTEHEYYSLGSHRNQRLLRILSTLADCVVGVTEPVTSFLRETVGIASSRLQTIRNGVDVLSLQSAEPLDRSTFGWSVENCIIGCLARLEAGKGHAVLLQALTKVLPRCPNARLLLIGDGTQRNTLSGLIKQLGLEGKACMLGHRDDVPNLLQTCDVVALASEQEGLPLALLEAMAAGKPVVSTAVGGIPGLVQEGSTGLLVPVGDADALAVALSRLVAKADERTSFGRRALQLAATQYNIHSTISQYRWLFNRLAGA